MRTAEIVLFPIPRRVVNWPGVLIWAVGVPFLIIPWWIGVAEIVYILWRWLW